MIYDGKKAVRKIYNDYLITNGLQTVIFVNSFTKNHFSVVRNIYIDPCFKSDLGWEGNRWRGIFLGNQIIAHRHGLAILLSDLSSTPQILPAVKVTMNFMLVENKNMSVEYVFLK